MKIQFLSHYFPPEGNAPATRVGGLTKRWVQAGHAVSVITSVPNVPNGVPYEGFRNRWWPQKNNWNGVQVFRIWTFLAPNAGTAKRILNYLSYWMSATLCVLFMPRPDVLIATSPQFFCGWAGVFSKWIYRLRAPWKRPVRFVLEIRDIWPESIGAVQAMKGRVLMRFLQWMEHRMYRAADHIVTVGEGYRRLLIEKGIPAEKISVVMNGVDWDLIRPSTSDAQITDSSPPSGNGTPPFVCAYIGTVGMACGLEIVLEAAQQLQLAGRDDVRFWIVGDGAVRQTLESQARERSLNSVVFWGRVSKEDVVKRLEECDCCLVHLKKTPLFETVIPSKMFEAWGKKRPLIMGVRGEAARMVQESNSGICIEPESANALLTAIESLRTQPEHSKTLGENGFRYVTEHFDRDRLAETYSEILTALVEQGFVPQSDPSTFKSQLGEHS